jgi:hypothetical protein
MTLADLLSDIPPQTDLTALWLAFPADIAEGLRSAQQDQTSLRVEPIQLTDGRYAVCADLLSEIADGGVYAQSFARLNAALFDHVEVITAAEYQSLQPQSEIL